MNELEYFTIQDVDGKTCQEQSGESLEEEKAILTHFLHNSQNDFSVHYEKDALPILKKYLRNKIEDELLILSDEAVQKILFEVENVPFPPLEQHSFTFIDLFAGIGGFRLAMQNVGGKCVYSSEWNNSKRVFCFSR